jgi:hypothetical protein
MDLNYLYQRQQVSLFRAQHAACGQSRATHQALAANYAARIEQAKSQRPQLALVA